MNEQFRKHMNQPVDIVIGEDTFKFKPLNVFQFTSLMIISDKVEKNKKDGEQMGEDTIKAMIALFKDIVKGSYPDLEDEEVDGFVVSNFERMGDILTKLSPSGVDERKANTFKSIHEKLLKSKEKEKDKEPV